VLRTTHNVWDANHHVSAELTPEACFLKTLDIARNQ
jgi:hypothetical protein